MALNLYTGLMGSGKSYEVVGFVIAPAIAAGIDVVTNVAGLDGPDAAKRFHDYIDANPSLFPKRAEVLGTIRWFEGIATQSGVEGLPQPFWPVQGEPDAQTYMRPGDLAVFDEIWRFWPEGSKVNPVDLAAFRMHRHFVNPVTGNTSNIVLITQSINDVSRMVRSVIEMAFRCKKLKTLGLTSTYNVRWWERSIGTEKNSVGFEVRRYKKDIFKLYKSYSQGDGPGKEVMADKRQNMLFQRKFIFGIPVAIAVALFAFKFAYGFFHPDMGVAHASTMPGASLGGPNGRLSDHPLNAAAKSAATVAATPWRIAGFLIRGSSRYVLLEDAAGRVRIEHGEAGQWEYGEPVSISLDGVLATRYTGSLPTASPEGPQAVAGGVPGPRGAERSRERGNALLGVLQGNRPSAETARAANPLD